MTPLAVISYVCIITYIVIILYILKGKTSVSCDKVITISAPTQNEIQQEKIKNHTSIIYPDHEFEEICRYILQEDPNPRKVVKLTESFTQEEKDTLLHCLNINNSTLYTEVLNLLNCNTENFEEYESIDIEIGEIDTLLSGSKNEKPTGGIPADFFLIAMEITPYADKEISDILQNIDNAYASLSTEDQGKIISQCSNLKKKRNKETKINPQKIIQESEEEAEEFMTMLQNLMQEN